MAVCTAGGATGGGETGGGAIGGIGGCEAVTVGVAGAPQDVQNGPRSLLPQ